MASFIERGQALAAIAGGQADAWISTFGRRASSSGSPGKNISSPIRNQRSLPPLPSRSSSPRSSPRSGTQQGSPGKPHGMGSGGRATGRRLSFGPDGGSRLSSAGAPEVVSSGGSSFSWSPPQQIQQQHHDPDAGVSMDDIQEQLLSGIFESHLRDAEAGSASACFQVAQRLRGGIGVEKDPSRAIGWYRKAGKNGSPEALEALGRLYESGELGLQRNAQKAAKYLKLAERRRSDADAAAEGAAAGASAAAARGIGIGSSGARQCPSSPSASVWSAAPDEMQLEIPGRGGSKGTRQQQQHRWGISSMSDAVSRSAKTVAARARRLISQPRAANSNKTPSKAGRFSSSSAPSSPSSAQSGGRTSPVLRKLPRPSLRRSSASFAQD